MVALLKFFILPMMFSMINYTYLFYVTICEKPVQQLGHFLTFKNFGLGNLLPVNSPFVIKKECMLFRAHFFLS